MEALVRELPSLISRCTVYAGLFVVLDSCLVDFCYCAFQVFMHISIKNRMSNIISQVKRAHQQNVNPGDFCYSIYLITDFLSAYGLD